MPLYYDDDQTMLADSAAQFIGEEGAIGKEGGQLKLLNLTQKLQDLLTITKLLTVFDVYESEPEALNSFK